VRENQTFIELPWLAVAFLKDCRTPLHSMNSTQTHLFLMQTAYETRFDNSWIAQMSFSILLRAILALRLLSFKKLLTCTWF
jgi:hypothetical protein